MTPEPIDYTSFYEASPYREAGMSQTHFLDLVHRHTDHAVVRTGWPPNRAGSSSSGAGWVVFHPRPTSAANPDLSSDVLATRQGQWDEADQKFRGQIADIRQREEAKDAALKAEQADRDQQALDRVTDDLRSRYFSVPGGTEVGFQKALPDLLERRRQDAALGSAYDDPASAAARHATRPRM